MLEKYRRRINKIDKKLLILFEKRMDISTQVGEYKRAKNMEICVPEREKEILDNIKEITKNPEYKEYTVEFFKKLIDISKALQNKD